MKRDAHRPPCPAVLDWLLGQAVPLHSLVHLPPWRFVKAARVEKKTGFRIGTTPPRAIPKRISLALIIDRHGQSDEQDMLQRAAFNTRR